MSTTRRSATLAERVESEEVGKGEEEEDGRGEEEAEGWRRKEGVADFVVD
jgi:hypothetical protein